MHKQVPSYESHKLCAWNWTNQPRRYFLREFSNGPSNLRSKQTIDNQYSLSPEITGFLTVAILTKLGNKEKEGGGNKREEEE